MKRLTPGTIEHLEHRISDMRWGTGLRRTADKLFSIWRRYGESRVNEMGAYVAQCISCRRWYYTSLMDAGHFIPRSKNWCRYHDDNVWPQCKGCNKWSYGNLAEYEKSLVEKGINVDYLHVLKVKPGRPSDDELRDMIVWWGEECLKKGFEFSRVTHK